MRLFLCILLSTFSLCVGDNEVIKTNNNIFLLFVLVLPIILLSLATDFSSKE